MNDQTKKTEDAQIQKENEDLPNIPAATDKIEEVEKVKEEINHTSDLQKDGKTDNTERNSEN
ncbi:hypothetical protein [Chryseobacterium sp. MP_3.2]|uniref:hypothetical protein n=1 Tax=Chryseobacterium sp. MP_3.2 TaxID=3071712 RepID=UPI002DFF023A|nr:hypothetical protein [Chryseobacterium sp. MP_3.2]